TVVITRSSMKWCFTTGSLTSVERIGAGSARPDVSITTRRNGGTSPRVRISSSRRSSPARSARSEQQTQPLPSTTVCSLTRRSRWWSIATSPSSLTITAVSPIPGWSSSRERSVVLPLPRKPVRTATGIGSAKCPDQLGVQRVERTAGEERRRRPDAAQVADDRAPALAVAEHVGAPGPVVEVKPVVVEDAIDQPDPEDPLTPAGVLLGPVVAHQSPAERAH